MNRRMNKPGRLDVLMVSEQALWPLDQGYRVHGYHMATTLAKLGLRVGVAAMTPSGEPSPQALRRITLDWPAPSHDDVTQWSGAWDGPLAPLRRKLAVHQAIDLDVLPGLNALVRKHQPQAVIALGQHGPILLQGLKRNATVRRIWYAADEPIYFQCSCLRRLDRRQGVMREIGTRLRHITLYAALENLFARGLDGAVGVSPRDSRLLKLFAGVRRTETIRNGVDLNYFHPAPIPQVDLHIPKSVIFWGRMDFEPNIDAVSWFAREIWPHLQFAYRAAKFYIVGKNPTPRVRELANIVGVEVVGEVEDVRPWAWRSMVTVLPIRCGGGIKNKLLEAAAMGLPMIASPKAVQGLELGDPRRRRAPLMIAKTPDEWVAGVRRIWADPCDSRTLRDHAREWAEHYHAWPRAAEQLIRFCRDLGCDLSVTHDLQNSADEAAPRLAA